MKKTYKVNTAMNFSIGTEEFYLTVGAEVELPEHELIDSLVQKNHLTKIEKASKKTEVLKTN